MFSRALMVSITIFLTALPASAQIDRIFKSESFDIDHYVLTKALDGLFHVLGQEERKIRTNPAARVTDLLKEVFRK